MKDITIREIQTADMPQIQELIATRPELDKEGARKRTELMKWIAFHNPYAGTDVTYFVAEQHGKIIAYHGRMPSDFNFKGTIKKGYFIHDLYVDPECRKKGMGFWLTMAFAKEIEEKSSYFFILIWMTGFNLLMQRRRGYLELEQRIATYMKVFKSKTYLKGILKVNLLATIAAPFVDLGLRLWDFIKLDLGLPKADLTKVTRFDRRFDDLIERVSPSLGISSVKRSQVLNWRYIDRPYPRDTIYARESDNQIKGFVVVCANPRDSRRGEIIDLMADPDDHQTINLLIKGAVNHFRNQGCHHISCFMGNHKLSQQLRRCVFLTRKDQKIVLLGNCEASDQHTMRQLQNWHITKAESDGFMLNFN